MKIHPFFGTLSPHSNAPRKLWFRDTSNFPQITQPVRGRVKIQMQADYRPLRPHPQLLTNSSVLLFTPFKVADFMIPVQDWLRHIFLWRQDWIITVLELGGYSEKNHFTWMIFVSEVSAHSPRPPLWVGLSVWVVITSSCEQQCFFLTNPIIRRQSALLVTSDGDFTVAQGWLWQSRSCAFMTLPFLRNTFDTIGIWLPASLLPQGIFTVFLSSADPATVLFSFLSSLIYSVIVSWACGFWEGWLAGSVRHERWNVCPRGGSQISSWGPEANSRDDFVARNSKNQNGYCR